MKTVVKFVLAGTFFSFFSCYELASQNTAPDIQVSPAFHVEVSKKGTKSRWLIVGVGHADAVLHEIGSVLKRALEWTDLVSIDVVYSPERFRKKQVLDLKESGYDMVIFFQEDKDDKAFEWRAYDTRKAHMQKGYSLKKEGKEVRGWGYALVDSLLDLMGQKPFTSTKLAYVQHEKDGKSTIIIADFDGSHPEPLIHSKTDIIGLRWNKDCFNPLLLFSQYTPTNIRLISCDMQKNKVVASSFDGLNMLPTFSDDGKQVVLCLSRDGSSQLYHYGYNDNLGQVGYTRLTYNKSTNICPTFLSDGNIAFCSDFELGRPQLYVLKRNDNSVERLTNGAASSSPQYNCVVNKLVYTKNHNGTMQAYVYDFEEGKERQVTFDKGHKQECAWSACGNYIICGLMDGEQQSIVSYSLITGSKKIVSQQGKRCSYPVWSVLLRPFPRMS